MLKNYLLVAIRNLRRNKFFSIINILGLSIGIAASLLMLNYLRFEKSYDEFHANAHRIYRVPMEVVEKGQQSQSFAFTYPAVAGALRNDFPEVEDAIRFRASGGLVTVEDHIIADLKTFWVDENVFKVFSFAMEEGDPAKALAEPENAAITKATAMKLFGNTNAIGKTFIFRGQLFKVTAVLNTVPENSHLKFDILLPYKRYIEIARGNGGDAENSWGWSDFYTYILLRGGHDRKELEDKFPSFAKRHLGPDMIANGYDVAFHLQPLKEIHARSQYDYELEGNGNYAYLDYVAIAGFFILFMAWLNYVNLSTSRSLERAKEVGVRKAIGAINTELIKQFLLESLLVNGLAILGGIILMLLVNPYVSSLTGKTLAIPSIYDLSFWGLLLPLLLVGALLAGFYPAFVLSSFKPFQVLKGKTVFGNHDARGILRKSLVVIQISLAVILISGTTGLLRQVQFMHDQNIGVNIKQILVLRDRVNRDSSSVPVIESFEIELKKNPAIISVTASTDVPGKEIGGSSGYRRKESQNPKRCRNFEVDENFFNDYELKLVAGRGFVKETPARDVILNETAVKVLGFENAEEAINRDIVDDGNVYTIIGVIKDYHQESLQYDFNPTVFFLQKYGWDYYSLKVRTNDMASLIALVEKSWKQSFADSPFDYFFLDEYYNSQYKSEVTFGVLLTSFTLLGILVAGLGLIGLSSFTVSKRTREIGVRKILGASATQIVALMTKEYLILIMVAFGAAIPCAAFLLDRWLEGYAFRISLGLWFFAVPFLLIVGITLLSVGIQSIRAAIANPVNSLRSE